MTTAGSIRAEGRAVPTMVLLDATFPEELELERYIPQDERWTHTEWKDLEE